MADLRTDYKDQLLDTSVNTERRYNLVDSDGNIVQNDVSLRDVTVYSQEGDSFGAGVLNGITGAINDLNGSLNNMVNDLDDLTPNDDFEVITFPFTAPKTGFVYIDSINYENSWALYINVNSQTLHFSGASKSMDSAIFPVKKGDAISIIEAGNIISYTALFR